MWLFELPIIFVDVKIIISGSLLFVYVGIECLIVNAHLAVDAFLVFLGKTFN